VCLHVQKPSGLFGGLAFSAPQNFLKSFQIALIGWINVSPPKRSLILLTCKQVNNVAKRFDTFTDPE